jgi:nucleoside-diphosphate-sugar epimerase
VLALDSLVHGNRFNVVSDRAFTIRELAEAVVRRLPTEIEFSGARVGDVPSARVSNRRAREVLGWTPSMSFERGLNEIIDWQLGQRRASTAAA